jgi:hypothetical protein
VELEPAFLECHPLELARQLTLQDFALLFELSQNTRQLLRQAWSKSGKHENAPQVCALIDKVNKVIALNMTVVQY